MVCCEAPQDSEPEMKRVGVVTSHLCEVDASRPLLPSPSPVSAKSASGKAAAAEIARIRAEDPHAPHFHFIAPDPAFPFDPNGALFWKGRYHLFYIFQDASLRNGGHCW